MKRGMELTAATAARESEVILDLRPPDLHIIH